MMNQESILRGNSRGGFSLLELLLVLLILGLLSSAAAISFIGQGEQAKVKTARIQMQTLKQAVVSFNFSVGEFPTMQQGLRVLMPNYVEEKALIDPWKKAFEYYYPTSDPNNPFDIVSAGPDKLVGTADDLNLFNENLASSQ